MGNSTVILDPTTRPADWLRSVGAENCPGFRWACQFSTLREAWDACPNPGWLLEALDWAGYRDDPASFCVACRIVREVWHLLDDERSRRAVEVVERFAAGLATEEELAAARVEAEAATQRRTWDARDPARKAAAATTVASVYDVAIEVGEAVTLEVKEGVRMGRVARLSLRAACLAAMDAARARQCAIIREEIDPWGAKR